MNEEPKWNLGKRLCAVRHYRRLSQQKIADHLKIDRSTYAYYEIGRSFPSMRVFREICLYLKVPPQFLLNLPSIPDIPWLKNMEFDEQ